MKRSGAVDGSLHYVTHGARELRNPGSTLRGAGGEVSLEAAMKTDWDARARADAMHFVASQRLDWDEQAFSESGRGAVAELVEADLERVCAGRDPGAMRALEIGCGIGRMTEHLAGVFGEVYGTDVSGEMIVRGRRRLAQLGNVTLLETSGSDLSPFEDDFFDFAFSFIVFQHVPSKEIVLANLREAHRTLRPGAIIKFQVKGLPPDPAPADTWVGVSFDCDELERTAEEIGFDVLGCEGAGTLYLWSWWRRKP